MNKQIVTNLIQQLVRPDEYRIWQNSNKHSKTFHDSRERKVFEKTVENMKFPKFREFVENFFLIKWVCIVVIMGLYVCRIVC